MKIGKQCFVKDCKAFKGTKLKKKNIYLCSLDELLCGCTFVVLQAAPGLQSRSLQGSAEREGEGPGLHKRAVIDGIEVDRGLFLTLSTR